MKQLLLLILIVSISILSEENNKSQPLSEEIEYQLLSIVKPILTGSFSDVSRSSIHPEAYLIRHNSYESIFNVLKDDEKGNNFFEGPQINFNFIKIRLTDDQQNAYMVLNTNNGNWHSILFVKEETNIWKVISWHKS